MSLKLVLTMFDFFRSWLKIIFTLSFLADVYTAQHICLFSLSSFLEGSDEGKRAWFPVSLRTPSDFSRFHRALFFCYHMAGFQQQAGILYYEIFTSNEMMMRKHSMGLMMMMPATVK